MTRSPILGPNQLEYCRRVFPIFSLAEKQALAARQDTKAYREKYPVAHTKVCDRLSVIR